MGGGYIDQPDLPFSEPSTSRDAAISMAPHVSRLQALVLAHIRSCGLIGSTDDEGYHILDMRQVSYGARRNELVAKGRVVDSGRTRVATSRRDVKVWVSVDG